MFTNPKKVHRIRYNGPHYQIDGIHLSEPSPQRTPVLFQAGASSRGRAFAARHAECVFINGPSQESAASTVKSLRTTAQSLGRHPDDLTIFLGANVIVASTNAEAIELYKEYSRYLDAIGQLVLYSGWTGIDLSQFKPEDVVPFVKSNAIQSTLENLTVRSSTPTLVQDLYTLTSKGARAPFIVGTPASVAEELIDWVDKTGIDGFNIARLSVPNTLLSIVDLLVPELQNRGYFKTGYSEGTLREKLKGGGSAFIQPPHPATKIFSSI